MVETGRYMRELFSYIERFAGERFVVKIDDRLLPGDMFGPLVQDLGQLRKIGVRLMIIAGARLRIDEVLATYGIENRIVSGTRVSPPAAMPLIEMAAFDVATKIMTRMTGLGIEAVIGNWVRARTIGVRDGIDFENSGIVDAVDCEKLDRLTEQEIVPILPCIGWNRRGVVYNISSNHLASELAKNASAKKLIYCLPEKPDLPNRLTADDAAHIDDPQITDDLKDMLRYSCAACTGGVDRVHLVNASADGAVLEEVFSNVGVGTMIYANRYDGVRACTKKDLESILRIMQPYIADGRLIHRSESELLEHIDELHVYEIDGTIHGVAGLSRIDDEFFEVYGLAIDESARNLGVGKTLIGYLLERANEAGAKRVFALTTQAYDWFNTLGFEKVDARELPENRPGGYNRSRNSRVVAYDLTRPRT